MRVGRRQVSPSRKRIFLLGTRAAEVRQDRSEGIAEVFLYEGNMKLYVSHPTQEQRILDLAKRRGSKGFFAYELAAPRPHGLGILQYNSRVWGLRKKGYNIVNKKPGYFVYEN